MRAGDPVVTELRARLLSASGFAESAVAPELLERALSRRAMELGLASAEDAARRALGDRAELARLEAHFAPPESWLFRYPDSYALLRAHLRARGPGQARVLSLGAGGWAEPLSIAAAAASAGTPAAIEAIDRNAALAAPAGSFSAPALRAGLPPWAEPHFAREGDALRPDAALRAMVSWTVGDVVEEARARLARGVRYDAVFFRNVAIYMGAAPRRAALEAIAGILAPDGILLVGHAELALAAELSGLAPHADPAAFALQPAARPSSAGPAAPVAAPDPRVDPRPMAPAPRRMPPAAGDPIEQLRARIASEPLDAALQVALARLLDERGARAESAAALGRALYLEPACEEALVLAARFAEERGAADEAERLRMRALRAHLARNEGGA